MKFLYTLLFVCLSLLNNAQTILFSETFPNTAGFANWTNVDLTASGRPVFLMNAGQAGTAFTTQSNGYAYCFPNNGLTVPQAYNSAMWNKTPINCVGKSVVVLKFEEVFNSNTQTTPGNLVYFDSTFVEVSKDSVNWVKFLVRTGASIPSGKKYVNISSEAANQATVYVRFRTKGFYWYIWFIDDVEVYEPPAYDVKNVSVGNPEYLSAGSINVSTNVVNNGSTTITSLGLKYTINGANLQSATTSGLNIPPLTSGVVTHTIPWNTPAGLYTIETTTGDVNGNADITPNDNVASKNVVVAGAFLPRKPMFELFTSSTNSFCLYANVNYHNILNSRNDSNYVDIKYQQDFPNNGDPYTTTEGVDRRNLAYGINSIPRMEINGGWDDNTSIFSESLYQSAANTPAVYDLRGEFSVDSITKTINDIKVVYKPLLNMTPGLTKLYIAIVEKDCKNNVKTNGEPKFFNVMKKMIPSAAGTVITTLTANTIDSLMTSYTFNGNYRLPADGSVANRIDHSIEHSVESFNNLRVIAWVQNTATKQIFQAANLTKINKIIKLTNPNGGEVWSVGFSKNITWFSQNVKDVKLEYSTNNGASWNIITNSVPALSGSYAWTVPNAPSLNCLVRVTDAISPVVNDISDNVFEIKYPVNVIEPNGGETWTVGSSKNIIWDATVDVTNVKIEYSTNGGLIWNTILASYAASNGFYAWTVPNTPSTNCLIKVSVVGSPSLFDLSNGAFTIALPPSLSLTAPNGFEVWNVGSSQNIKWNAVSIQNVKLEYTFNNGASWNTIAGSVLASTGIYPWIVPNTTSTTCRVRITDINNLLMSDESDTTFTIYLPPTVVVTSPNGGETWNVGTNKNITWTSSVVNKVKIELSTNGGSNWSTIANGVVASIGSYSWNVPNNVSNNCLIRISDSANATLNDISNTAFSITLPTNITLTNPNGGELWTTNSSHNITWTSSAISDIKIEYSLNGGGVWNTIISSTPAAAGSFNWNLPSTPSSNCKVRVTDITDVNNTDISDAVFSIALPPSVTVVSPNGGEVWNVGDNQNIVWVANAVSDVKIEYTINNGGTWNTITSSTPAASGSYSWNVPNSPTTNAKVRISDAMNISLIDASNNNFTIQNPTSIQLTSPNGGEVWDVGTAYDITWTALNVANVKIEYSINGGSSWTVITASTPMTSGSYSWTIPNFPSTTCKVRVSDASNSSLNDISNQIFTIRQPPSLVLTTPNGGETWENGSSHNIEWKSKAISNIKIEFSNNGGGTWTVLSSSFLANLESYSWTISSTPSNNCLIRLTDVSNPSVSSTSLAVFKIVIAPNILITSPNGNENWEIGSVHPITWTSAGVLSARIEYSIDNGLKWDTINPSYFAALGTYSWTIPNRPSNKCKIRMTSTGDSTLFAMSNGNFSISKKADTVKNALVNADLVEVNISPNPFKKFVSIHGGLQYDAMMIYDVQGKVAAYYPAAIDHVYQLENLNIGAYTLQLMKDNRAVYQMKLVKEE